MKLLRQVTRLSIYSKAEKNLSFITGLTGSSKLHQLSQVTVDSAKKEFVQTGKPVKRCHTFMYKVGSWEEERVIVKAEVNGKETNIRYIATSDLESLQIRL